MYTGASFYRNNKIDDKYSISYQIFDSDEVCTTEEWRRFIPVTGPVLTSIFDHTEENYSDFATEEFERFLCYMYNLKKFLPLLKWPRLGEYFDRLQRLIVELKRGLHEFINF